MTHWIVPRSGNSDFSRQCHQCNLTCVKRLSQMRIVCGIQKKLFDWIIICPGWWQVHTLSHDNVKKENNNNMMEGGSMLENQWKASKTHSAHENENKTTFKRWCLNVCSLEFDDCWLNLKLIKSSAWWMDRPHVKIKKETNCSGNNWFFENLVWQRNGRQLSMTHWIVPRSGNSDFRRQWHQCNLPWVKHLSQMRIVHGIQKKLTD